MAFFVLLEHDPAAHHSIHCKIPNDRRVLVNCLNVEPRRDLIQILAAIVPEGVEYDLDVGVAEEPHAAEAVHKAALEHVVGHFVVDEEINFQALARDIVPMQKASHKH